MIKKLNDFSFSPLVSIHQNERPVDWFKQFGCKGPVIIEIGSGLGEFIIRQAEQFPGHRFIGIEYDWTRVAKTLRRLSRLSINNIRLLNTDARFVFERLILPSSVDRVISLFPCPWPKRSHAKHRLFSREFLQLINSRLVAQGELKIVTDFYPYVEWVKNEIPATGFSFSERVIPPQFDTKFERKWQGQGQSQFWELMLLKQEAISVPVKEDILLRPFVIADFNPKSFSMADEKKDTAILFKECFYDAEKSRAMVHVIVVEKNLTQHVWIAVIKKPRNWLIRPLEGCLFIPTAGVQRALELVWERSKPS